MVVTTDPRFMKTLALEHDMGSCRLGTHIYGGSQSEIARQMIRKCESCSPIICTSPAYNDDHTDLARDLSRAACN